MWGKGLVPAKIYAPRYPYLPLNISSWKLYNNDGTCWWKK